MDRKDEPKSGTTAAQSGDQTANTPDQPVDRRSAFRGGLLGLASVIAAACSGTDFSSSSGDRKQGKKASGNDAGDGFGDGGQDDVGGKTGSGEAGDEGNDDDIAVDGSDGSDVPPPSTDIDRCAATTTQKVDTTGMPGIDNAPVVKIYGKPKSRMVAIQFNAATTIDQLLIATASGRVLALHIPSNADKNASGWRPIVIDPLDFNEGGTESKEVVIVIQQGATRKQHRENLTPFDMFDGKPVVDLTMPTATSGWDFTKQSVARFNEDKASYKTDDNPSIIYPGSRKLKTAQTSTKLNISDAALHTGQKPIPNPETAGEGFITDIMGNKINRSDIAPSDTSAGFFETMVFCTYRPDAGGTKFFRTMIFVA